MPQVVLCDIGLPGLDGYSVARQLRQEQGSNKIFLIAVSGYGQEEDQERAKSAGFDAYLVKPISLKDLEKLLAELSGRYKPEPWIRCLQRLPYCDLGIIVL